MFYASKVPEFLDTILMCLKRNFRQITFLHVYHHSSIFIIWWFIMSYVPGGSSYFSAALNSFVHVVMYGYYLWASLAPKLPIDPTTLKPLIDPKTEKPVLDSKTGEPVMDPKSGKSVKPRFYQPQFYRQYITTFQLIQFCLNFFQATYMIFWNPPKDFAMFNVWILFFYMITMLMLFGNFYIKSYGKKPTSKVEAADGAEAKKNR